VLLGHAYDHPLSPAAVALRLYVEVWRGLPIIVTIFLVYYACRRRRTCTYGSARSRARRSA
jgi:ABC-type amino acid transport system permease subunit